MTNNKQQSIVNRITLDSKSMLARLLASENIIVEHVPEAETAYFETQTRRLVLPVWNNMDEDTYDMLVGHEVGHALYTPTGSSVVEQAIASIDPNNPGLVKHYLNVVEDARIERLMKRRYPGLAHNFRRAYTAMYERDMFGFRRSVTDPASLCTIDRLNLRAKIGVHAEVDVPLNVEESLFFHDMMRTETWDDMVALTRRIYLYAKEPQVADEPSDGGGTRVDHGPGDGQGSGGDGGGDIIEDESPSGDAGGAVTQPTKPTDKQPGEVNNNVPPEPITNNYTPPVDKRADSIAYINMPAKFDIDRYIYTYDQIIADHAGRDLRLHDYDEFRTDSRKYVNMLVKEFELRKAADIHSRTSIARSGVLDMNRLHQHQYVEDIFRRNAVVREGKNHGMVMIIDGSSSMSPVFDNTVRQVMQLVWFCRAANIPFDVYIFSNNTNPVFRNMTVGGEITNDMHLGPNFMMFNVLSSRMSSSQFARAMSIMYHQGKMQWSHSGNSAYGLSGTPLFKSIVAARYIVEQFRSRYNLQVVNTIFLTDGDDGDRIYNGRNEAFGSYNRAVLRDMATRSQVAISGEGGVAQSTEAMLNMLRYTTGTNVVGIYLINSHGGKRVIANFLGIDVYGEQLAVEVTKFRNQKYLEIRNRGYDAFFVVPGDQLGGTLAAKDEYLNKSLTPGRIAGAFLRNERAKQVNRVLLSRFVGIITR